MTHFLPKFASTFVLVAVLGACGRDGRGHDDPPLPDGDLLEFDAAMLPGVTDAGPPDAGLRDAGPRDGGPRDAGRPDLGATRYVCRGVPYSCVGGASTCLAVQGCRVGGECTGYASSCYSRYSSYSCNSQDGCYWSSYSSNCSGSARSCASEYDSYGCNSQDGCSWSDTCEGSPTPCSLFTDTSCSTQPGCYRSPE